MPETSCDNSKTIVYPIPVAERPTEHLFNFGPGVDYQAQLGNSLRQLNSLLRITMIAVCQDEDPDFSQIDNRDFNELIFMLADLAEDAENSAKHFNNQHYEAVSELERRVKLLSDT